MRKSRKRKTALLPRANDSASTVKISDRQKDVFGALIAYGAWAQPMGVGGRDGSRHSATLNQLARKGFAERKKLHAIYGYNGSTQRQKLVDNHWAVTGGPPPSTACYYKAIGR